MRPKMTFSIAKLLNPSLPEPAEAKSIDEPVIFPSGNYWKFQEKNISSGYKRCVVNIVWDDLRKDIALFLC